MIEVTLNVDGLVEPGGGFTSTASGVILQFATGGLMSGTGACANADDDNKPATPKAPANPTARLPSAKARDPAATR